MSLIRANLILGRILMLALSFTLVGFVIFIRFLGPWAYYVFGFIAIQFLLFFLTAFLATRDVRSHPKSRDLGIQFGRFYWFLTMIVPPLFIDTDFILVGIVGMAVLILSYVYGTKKELQLFLVNCLGMLVWGLVTIAGISGLVDSFA